MNVRTKQTDSDKALRKIIHLTWKLPHPRKRYANEHHKEQRWQYSSRTSLVEVNDAKSIALDIFNEDCCNQIATDYEENINTYKATTK